MTDLELIARVSRHCPEDVVNDLIKRLQRKAPTQIVPTADEEAAFEDIWQHRRKFIKRPGDPKRPALLKFCRQMREKPADIEAIKFGITNEYSAKKDRPELYAQMETFMGQRRWETYDYDGYKARLSRSGSANVVNFQPETKQSDSRPSEEERRAQVARLLPGYGT